ncbi:uncharacterized protein [Henckelia pumila]
MENIDIFLYFGGHIIVDSGSIVYSIPYTRPMRVLRTITLSELVEAVHQILRIDPTTFTLKLSTKYSFMENSSWHEIQVNLVDDNALEFMMQSPNIRILHLYVEANQIDHHVGHVDQESDILHVTEGMDNMYLYPESGSWDQYIAGTSEPDPASWPESTRIWEQNYGEANWNSEIQNFVPRVDDPRSENEDVQISDTEPEMSYGESEEEDDDDVEDVNDDVHVNIHANTDEGTSSRPPPRQKLQRQDVPFFSTTSDMPSFFNTYFGEEIPDSIGVPHDMRTRYYNEERGELCVNMVFKDKKDLIASVKDYSVRVSRREYLVVESTRILWKIQCKNDSSTVRCRWGLRASFKEKTGYWKITRYGGPHTCISTNVGIDHHNLNSDMVAHTLLGIVRCDPSYEIKYIIESVKDKYGYQISYTKAWRSLKRAVEIVYGTWESSVQLLPKYMRALCKYNIGTIVDWKHLRNNEEIKTLNYCFWAFKPCTNGFQHCRKIISVDGTHLYTKYKHKMLIAVTLDANNQVLPLAFAIVDEETSDSWKWFLENVGRHVVCGENGVCLISDRHKGIVRAVEDLPYFKPP